jgi:hypothetical protein
MKGISVMSLIKYLPALFVWVIVPAPLWIWLIIAFFI